MSKHIMLIPFFVFQKNFKNNIKTCSVLPSSINGEATEASELHPG